MKHTYIIYVLLATLLMACNNGSSKAENDSSNDTPKQETSQRRSFDPDFDVMTFTSMEDYRHAIDHYWDSFDFDAGEEVANYDTTCMIQAMADYIAYLGQEPQRERCDSLLRDMMCRATKSRPVLDYFMMMTEEILHDPNSPLRNDEFYIPILEVVVASPLLDEYERIAPQYDLELARQNRIGTKANDIILTTANGRKQRLHDIKAEYIILIFSNPGCPMCREIIDELTSSPLINEFTENGMLKTISIYPDEDIEAWRDYLPEMPTSWLVTYDQGMKITAERSYNLQAIPSLYLLDREKRVVIKDATNVAMIENAIAYIDAL